MTIEVEVVIVLFFKTLDKCFFEMLHGIDTTIFIFRNSKELGVNKGCCRKQESALA